MRRALTLFALCLGLAGSSAHAESPRGLALALSGADGTVRTQANVKVAVSAIPGYPDYAVAMSGPVRARMGEIRGCFGSAMGRSSSVDGRATFELEALAQGRSRVRIKSDQTGDGSMVECMRDSLSRAELKNVPRGARSLVSLDVINPSARLRAQVERNEERVPVRVLPDGRVESQGGTQQGAVAFRIEGPVAERAAIEALHRDVAARFAGLLDCRRKAGRHGQSIEGTVTLALELEQGRVARARPTAERSLGRKAPACVVEWLDRADPARIKPANLQLAITFGHD